MPSIYLASPYGFAESTRGFLGGLKGKLREAGFDLLDPWELGETLVREFQERAASAPAEQRIPILREMNKRLGKTNHDALERADVVVAGLDGPDIDSGTASEIGYAFARGKTIVGYRDDLRKSGENEAAPVNLQVQYWIESSHGKLVRSIAEIVDAVKSATSGSVRK